MVFPIAITGKVVFRAKPTSQLSKDEVAIHLSSAFMAEGATVENKENQFISFKSPKVIIWLSWHFMDFISNGEISFDRKIHKFIIKYTVSFSRLYLIMFFMLVFLILVGKSITQAAIILIFVPLCQLIALNMFRSFLKRRFQDLM
jgi:hypothetical protein